MLPLTERTPKCLLSVDGEQPVLEHQLRALERCGVLDVRVMIGFGAEQVEDFLARRRSGPLEVRTLYNPFYATTENLITCWLAARDMDAPFVLLNGDTLFEDEVLGRILRRAEADAVMAIDCKEAYDDDDMKVALGPGGLLSAVGKKLDPAIVDGEAIGMTCFREEGARRFAQALDATVRGRHTHQRWYLSVLGELARAMPLRTASIQGLWWAEIDSPEDLSRVQAHFRQVRRRRLRPALPVAERPL